MVHVMPSIDYHSFFLDETEFWKNKRAVSLQRFCLSDIYGFVCLLCWEDSGAMTGKYWGGERGAGSAKDLEAGIKLGSLWEQLRYMSTR